LRFMYDKRPIYIYEKRPIYMKRDLEKRPTKENRSLLHTTRESYKWRWTYHSSIHAELRGKSQFKSKVLVCWWKEMCIVWKEASQKEEGNFFFLEVNHHTRWIQSFSNVKAHANLHVSIVNGGMNNYLKLVFQIF